MANQNYQQTEMDLRTNSPAGRGLPGGQRDR